MSNSGQESFFPETILDGKFSFVQSRLKSGAVYTNEDRSLYLRIGEKEATMTEETYTTSLASKGFPVTKVVAHGELNGQWYFIEESLGAEPLGKVFGSEYSSRGTISDKSFNDFMRIMEGYAQASFGAANRQIKGESLRDISFFNQTIERGAVSAERAETLMNKVEERLKDIPFVLLNTDLGPLNVMPGGVIDFELLHSGPAGYDLITAAAIGYYFPRIPGLKYQMTYEYTDEQLAAYLDMVDRVARANNFDPPSQYLNDFIFLKTMWAAARPEKYEKRSIEDPESKRFWEYRDKILNYAFDAYESNSPIDFTKFPDLATNASNTLDKPQTDE